MTDRVELKKCPAGSVGVVFEKDSQGGEKRYLVFYRLQSPEGWAGVAGHLDGDSPMTAAVKESFEEIGVDLGLVEPVLGTERTVISIFPNPCGRGGGIYNTHDWVVYRALKWHGEPRINEPHKHSAEKGIIWMTVSELKRAFSDGPHDPAWNFIFSALGII